VNARRISFKRIKRSRGSLSIIQRTKGISSLSRGLKNLPKGPLKLLKKSVKKYGKKAAKKIAKMLLKKPGEEGFEQLRERGLQSVAESGELQRLRRQQRWSSGEFARPTRGKSNNRPTRGKSNNGTKKTEQNKCEYEQTLLSKKLQ